MIDPLGRGPGRRDDRGTVTAETAVVLPSLLMVVAACVWLLSVAVAQLHCVDAAQGAARAAARGEPTARVRAAAVEAAPEGARVRIDDHDGRITVAVEATVRPFGGLMRLVPAVHVEATARAAAETG